ncbi:hypothetical protein HC928_02580 [bacterium]|nr:hypothetical protein [bacterium]
MADTVQVFTRDDGGVSSLRMRDDSGRIHYITGPQIVADSTNARATADGDNGRSIYYTAATAAPVAITVNSGTPGTFSKHTQVGTDQLQFTAGAGVTLRVPAAFLARAAQQYSAVVLEWRTATEVFVSGDLEPAP